MRDQSVTAAWAVVGFESTIHINHCHDFASRKMLSTVKLMVKSAITVRLISMAFLSRVLAVIEPIVICGLIVEGSTTDSLTYRLLANNSGALLLAYVMGTVALMCMIELTIFAFWPNCTLRRHVRGMPYVFVGMSQMVLSGALVASPASSPTLLTAYLLFGFFAAMLGFRIAIPDNQFARVGSV